MAQSICWYIWKYWWMVSPVKASKGMVGPVIWNGPGGRLFTLAMRVSGPSVKLKPVPPVPKRN